MEIKGWTTRRMINNPSWVVMENHEENKIKFRQNSPLVDNLSHSLNLTTTLSCDKIDKI